MKLTSYVQSAMNRAEYKLLEDKTYFGEVHPFPDIWAHSDNLADCRDRLQSVLEEWIIDQLYLHHAIPPVLDDINLDPNAVDEAEIHATQQALEEAEQQETVPLAG